MQAYTWTATVESATGSTSNASASFTTGLLATSDWGAAEWIDAGVCTQSADLTTTGNCSGGLLRTEFTVAASGLGRVSLFVSACQYYELYVDGQRVGDHQLDVAWTRPDLMRVYASYDLPASLFGLGKHALGLFVGQGFCGETAQYPNNTGRRAAVLSLRLHSASDDSVVQTVATTAGSWLGGDSPLYYESAYVVVVAVAVGQPVLMPAFVGVKGAGQ